MAQPRFATRRREERPTWGKRWGKIASLLGTPPTPSQQQIMDVAGEYDPATGLPFYREVVLLMMRQQGKTTIEFAAAVDRFVSWDAEQRGIYSAQTGGDASKKFLEDWGPALQRSPLGRLVRQVVKANGKEKIVMRDGSFLETMASLESSGHGVTRHFGFIDEAWKDHDERREQAIRPTMLTIPDAQLWVVSTAGNDASTYLRRKVEAGRAAAEEDRGSGVCYVEYSVPPDENPFDMDVMLRFMPALCPTPGPCECSAEWRHTVTHEVLAAEMQGMDPDEARRAFGNQWVAGGGERVISAELWDLVQDPAAAPSGRLRVALDVNSDRMSGAIVSAGDGCVELVDHRVGPPGWMVEAAKALRSAWGAELVIDGNGPAVPVAQDLESEGVPVTRIPPGEVVAACGRMYDAVADGKVRFRPSEKMDDAVSGLAKRPAGDRFVWSREASLQDATPFVAATLAFVPAEPEAVPLVRVV